MDECPFCGREIEDMQLFFEASEYATYFEMECEYCGGILNVEVEAMPYFCITRKPLTGGDDD